MELVEERHPGCAMLDRGIGGYHAFGLCTLAAGQNLEAGTVLARYQDKFYRLDPTAPNAKKDAAGVLYDNVNASTDDVVAVVIVRDCEIKGPELLWPEGITPEQKATAIGQLEARGVIVR